MLPTQGLFKDIECPFNENNCGRPYCHFRHKKNKTRTIREEENDDDGDDENVTKKKKDIPTYNPTPKSQLLNVTRNHIPISYVPDVVIRTNNRLNNRQNETPIYKPTPLSLLTATNHQKQKKADEDEHDTGSDADFLNKDEFELIDEILQDPGEIIEHENNKETIENDIKDKRNKNDDGEKKKSSRSSGHKKSRDKSKRKKDEERREREKKERKSNRDKKEREKKREHKKSSSDRRKSREKSGEKNKKHQEKSTEVEISYVPTKISELEKTPQIFGDDDFFDFDDDVEKECFKIFQEYQPETVEKKKIEDNFMVDNDDANLIGKVEPYIPTTKKRIAYDNAKNITPKIVPATPKYVPDPARVMTSRFKIARMRQADNEQNNLIAEVTRQEHLTSDKKLKNTKLLSKTTSSSKPCSSTSSSSKTSLRMPSSSSSTLTISSSKPSLSNSSNLKSSFSSSSSLNANITTLSSSKSSVSPNIPTNSLIDSIIAPKLTKTYIPGEIPGNSRKRKINPVTNTFSMLKAKTKLAELKNNNHQDNHQNDMKKTPSQTIGSGGNKNKRIAHVPDLSLAELPDVLHLEKSKLPVNVRTRYLTMMAEETCKLYVCQQDAHQRAVNEEFKVYERCNALMTYRNSAMLAVNRIRKEFKNRESSGLGPYETGDMDEEDDVRKNEKQRKKSLKLFYQNLIKYVLTEEELVENGYPREGTIPGRAIVKKSEKCTTTNLGSNLRECARCLKIYSIDKNGFPVYKEDCLYHPLKKRTFRGESWYLCCKSGADLGCVTAHTHVSEMPDMETDGFQTTLKPEVDDDDDVDQRNYAIYALDCEMCYTTRGLELTRVTIVDTDLKIVYDTFVKPLDPIIDYNTRFSGITKEHLDRTSTSILQVQANILHLCNSNTILIGHSLESDMKALKIVHSNIVDTAIMFPHKLGLPYKRALKTLAADFLKKIIQDGGDAGHDSAEDAITCMELVKFKLG